MQQAVWSVNSNLPVASISTMQDIYSHSMARTSFTLVMLAIAGSMALALGILGIYGVISYAVSQRTREIGIRMALGAKKSELMWMFVRSALVLTGVGTAIGLGAAAALMRLDANAIVRHQPARSGHIHGRTGCPGCCGGTGKLSAGAPHCGCRSRRSASSRVVRQRDLCQISNSHTHLSIEDLRVLHSRGEFDSTAGPIGVVNGRIDDTCNSRKQGVNLEVAGSGSTCRCRTC